MTSATSTHWLKRGLHRSVSLREGPSGAPEVVKHFRSRGWLRRLGDRRRAERELLLLRELHTAGLRVPQPYSVVRGAGGWELTCEWVEGARTLAELLREPFDLPVAPEVLARRLGTLLGHAHALGLEHGDLHAGNLLLDADGEAWLIDVAAARLGPGLGDQELERELIGIAADAREFTTLRLRQRFLVAWRARLGVERDARFRDKEALTALEACARDRRREALLDHADRWTRASGLCDERHLSTGFALIASCGGKALLAEEDALARIAALAAEGRPQAKLGELDLRLDLQPGAAARWTTLGRAWQHGLPTLTPLALLRGRESEAAVYAVPRGAVEDSNGSAPGGRALTEALQERGFRPETAGLWRDPDGAARLGPGCALRTEARRG